jgi:hypothetical protein
VLKVVKFNMADKLKLGNAKEREAADMMAMLENLSRDDLGTGKLPLVEPMEWKNVSIQLQTSIKILKEQ